MTRRLVLAAALATCAFLPVFGPCAPALAAGGAGDAGPQGSADSRLEIAMNLYAGGVSLGKVDFDATTRGGEYRIVSHLETLGVANAFWKATIQATSSGAINGRAVAPALYDSFTTRRDGKKQQVSLTYGRDGGPHLIAEPAYDLNEWSIKPEDQKNTFDPLSAVMTIVSGATAQAGNPCGLVAPVFDGRRRYNIEMSRVRDIDIKLDNGLWQGKGLLCQLRYKQVAGFRPTLVRAKDPYPLINAWMATFKSGDRTYTVPLRVWADTSFGLVTAVATSVKVDGAPPKS